MSLPFQLLFAQSTDGGPAGLIGGLAPFLIVFGILYFLMIRPQQKQAKEHKTMLTALKKGDEVVTTGGLVGRIHALTDKVLTLEIAKDVRVRVLKSAVQARVPEGGSVEEPAAETKEEKK